MPKKIIIDKTVTKVTHCNKDCIMSYQTGGGLICRHPIFDLGQDRQWDDIDPAFHMEDPIPKDCPLEEWSE